MSSVTASTQHDHCKTPNKSRPAEFIESAGVRLATASYRNWQPWMGLPIRSTVGHPRFIRYQLAGKAPELAPERDWLKLDRQSYEGLYIDKLNNLNAAGYPLLTLWEIVWQLRVDAEAGLGARLVFLCYEDLTKPGAWCHRRMLADWLGQCGIDCPELAPREAK